MVPFAVPSFCCTGRGDDDDDPDVGLGSALSPTDYYCLLQVPREKVQYSTVVVS